MTALDTLRAAGQLPEAVERALAPHVSTATSIAPGLPGISEPPRGEWTDALESLAALVLAEREKREMYAAGMRQVKSWNVTVWAALEERTRELLGEREKCQDGQRCGNCRHYAWPEMCYLPDDHGRNMRVLLSDPCHFDPSRWEMCDE